MDTPALRAVVAELRSGADVVAFGKAIGGLLIPVVVAVQRANADAVSLALIRADGALSVVHRPPPPATGDSADAYLEKHGSSRNELYEIAVATLAGYHFVQHVAPGDIDVAVAYEAFLQAVADLRPTPWGWWLVGGLGVAGAAGAGYWWWRRRRAHRPFAGMS